LQGMTKTIEDEERRSVIRIPSDEFLFAVSTPIGSTWGEAAEAARGELRKRGMPAGGYALILAPRDLICTREDRIARGADYHRPLYRFYFDDHDPDYVNFRRASGDAVCEFCDQPFRKHPFSEHRDQDGNPFLNKLCDGSLVKL